MSKFKRDDVVIRYLAGEIEIPMKVLAVKDGLVHCEPVKAPGIDVWTFDAETGAEIDEELGWGNHGTGSFIKPKAA